MGQITEEDDKKFYEILKENKKTDYWKYEARYYFHSKKNRTYIPVPIIGTFLSIALNEAYLIPLIWGAYWCWYKQKKKRLRIWH